MKSVFVYSDYRLYMADFVVEQKETRYGFSYQFFANLAGFKARDFIYRVIKGEKNISSDSALKIATAMGLTSKEADFFHTLAEFNQAKSSDKKMHFYQRMLDIKQVSRKAPTISFLADDQIEYFSTWYHAVIRSLIGLRPFYGDIQELACQVIPPISVVQAKKSVQLLQRLGLIALDEGGQYQITHATISTGDEYRSLALRTFYKECFSLAALSMDTIDQANRNISGVTVGLSEKSYSLLVSRLNDLRKEFLSLAEDDAEADRVYNLTMALIPVGRTLATKDQQ